MKTYHKDSSKSLRRLAFLEKYCTELLKCDPSVTQSSEVITFFLPQTQDLQPEFSRNRYVLFRAYIRAVFFIVTGNCSFVYFVNIGPFGDFQVTKRL